MESPNSRLSLPRRHTSRIGHGRRLILRNKSAMKFNPYVGWFRHAPSTISIKSKCYPADKSFIRIKNSPYVGWFRHSPPPSHYQFYLQKALSSVSRPYKVPHCLCDGRLRGGGKEDEWNVAYDSPPSATVKIISRLATWVFTQLETSILAEDADDSTPPFGLSNKYICHQPYDEHDEQDNASTVHEDSDDDDDDCSVDVRREFQDDDDKTTSPKLPTLDLDQDDQHRLDYVITQVDIARMVRTASRHLDVESILSLPTEVYRAPVEGSWLIVPADTKEVDVCVICLEQFKDGDRLRVLPCNHSFHMACVDRWLSGSRSHTECYTTGCPTCKKRPQQEEIANGSVPSWAFAQLGDAMARAESVSD